MKNVLKVIVGLFLVSFICGLGCGLGELTIWKVF